MSQRSTDDGAALLPLSDPDITQPHALIDEVEWTEDWSPGTHASMAPTQALVAETGDAAPPSPTGSRPAAPPLPTTGAFDSEGAPTGPRSASGSLPPAPPADALRRVLVTPAPPLEAIAEVASSDLEEDTSELVDIETAAFEDETPTQPKLEAVPDDEDGDLEPEAVDDLISEILAEESQPEGPAGTDRMRTTLASGWFQEIFDETYIQTLPANQASRCEREAAHIARLLNVKRGARLLDVACGPGHHVCALAALGFEMTALDKSRPLLEHGLMTSRRRSLKARFVMGDMREFRFDAPFDGAYCVGTSFGYFDDEQNLQTARNIRAALAPGASVVFEQVNRDWAIGQLPRRTWWESGDLVIMEDLSFDPGLSRLTMERSVLNAEQETWDQHISIRLYALHEWIALLTMAGFEVTSWGGHWATPGAFFDGRSSNVIVVAKNPG